MSIRPVPFLIGQDHHIYNRGVDKRVIFLDKQDYERFTALMYVCNSKGSFRIRDFLNTGKAWEDIFSAERDETLVDIVAYCLMPNHFHIFMKEKVEGGISMFMQKLSTAYSMYFNSKYGRTGGLFEGKFKAKYIDKEAYLNWVFSYIHLNPVKLIDPMWKQNGISEPEKAKKFMDSYKYSSYYDYFVGDRIEKVILNKDVFPHFNKMNDFEVLCREFSGGEEGLVR